MSDSNRRLAFKRRPNALVKIVGRRRTSDILWVGFGRFLRSQITRAKENFFSTMIALRINWRIIIAMWVGRSFILTFLVSKYFLMRLNRIISFVRWPNLLRGEHHLWQYLYLDWEYRASSHGMLQLCIYLSLEKHSSGEKVLSHHRELYLRDICLTR